MHHLDTSSMTIERAKSEYEQNLTGNQLKVIRQIVPVVREICIEFNHFFDDTRLLPGIVPTQDELDRQLREFEASWWWMTGRRVPT